MRTRFKILLPLISLSIILALTASWIHDDIKAIYSSNTGTLFDPQLGWKLPLYDLLNPYLLPLMLSSIVLIGSLFLSLGHVEVGSKEE